MRDKVTYGSGTLKPFRDTCESTVYRKVSGRGWHSQDLKYLH